MSEFFSYKQLEIMKKTLTLLLATFITVVAFSQSAKENEVWLRSEELNKAVFETKDSNAISELVSDNLTYGHSGGKIEERTEMIHAASTNPDSYKSVVYERVSARSAGNAIIIRHILRAEQVNPTGVSTPLNLGIIQVWAKEKGKWRIFARQAVKIAPK